MPNIVDTSGWFVAGEAQATPKDESVGFIRRFENARAATRRPFPSEQLSQQVFHATDAV